MRVARLRRGRGDRRSRLAEVIPNFLSPSTSQRWHASAAHVADCARSVSRSGAPESDRGGGAPADRTGATSGRSGGVVSGGTPRRRSGQPARAIAKRCSLLGARSLTAAFAVKGSQSCSRQFKRYATNSFESRRRVAPLLSRSPVRSASELLTRGVLRATLHACPIHHSRRLGRDGCGRSFAAAIILEGRTSGGPWMHTGRDQSKKPTFVVLREGYWTAYGESLSSKVK